MISPLIKWEHSEDWYVTSYQMQEKIKSGERTVVVTLKDDEQEYLSGHVIDGRNLYPATGYLVNKKNFSNSQSFYQFNLLNHFSTEINFSESNLLNNYFTHRHIYRKLDVQLRCAMHGCV